MTALFLSVIDRSIAASVVILAVIAARALTRRSPKWMRGALWALVALRLILPFAVHSTVSLVPDLPQFTQTEQAGMSESPTVDVPAVSDVKPPVVDVTPPEITDAAVQPTIPESAPSLDTLESDAPRGMTAEDVAAIVWLVGVAVMLLYFIIAYVRLLMKLHSAERTDSGVWQSDRIDTAFVLGVARPRIYLPIGIDSMAAEYMTAHERSHIRRGDHITKLFAFFLLAVHWFNPLMWLAYVLYSRDIELACDERAIRALGSNHVQEYARTIVSAGKAQRTVVANPILFAQHPIKARIRNILNYKKPSVLVISASLLVCVITAVCFATVPIAKESAIPEPAPTETEMTESSELETEPVSWPETEPMTEPVTEPETEPVTEPEAEPMTESVTEPETEPVTEPSTEVPTEPPAEPPAKPEIAFTPEPVVVSTPKPESELEPEKNITVKWRDTLPTGTSISYSWGYGRSLDAFPKSPIINELTATAPIICIRSWDEYTVVMSALLPDRESYDNYLKYEPYDREFFEDTALIIICHGNGQKIGSHKSLIKSGSELCINTQIDVWRSGDTSPRPEWKGFEVLTVSKAYLRDVDTISLYVQTVSHPNLDDAFADDSVLVVIKQEYGAINKVFTKEQFEASGVALDYVKDLMYIDNIDSPYLNKDDFHQIFYLKLANKGKEEVLKALDKIEELEFVKAAEPNYHLNLY